MQQLVMYTAANVVATSTMFFHSIYAAKKLSVQATHAWPQIQKYVHNYQGDAFNTCDAVHQLCGCQKQGSQSVMQ